MKRLLLISALTLVAGNAAAVDLADTLFTTKARALEMRCDATARLAAAVMELRQRGVAADAMPPSNPSSSARTLIAAAYEVPQQRTADARDAAVWEFAERANIACYREAASR